MNSDQITYEGYRYPPEIISQAFWFYHIVSATAILSSLESSVRPGRLRTPSSGAKLEPVGRAPVTSGDSVPDVVEMIKSA